MLPPLTCAFALAAGIAGGGLAVLAALVAVAVARRWRALPLVAIAALGAARSAPPPARYHPGDRVRLVGVVGGPLVRGAHGTGAPLDVDGEPLWLWTDGPLLPGDRVAVTGTIRDPRGPLDPALPDRLAALAARGARAELWATSVEHLGATTTPWRLAALAQRRWGAALDAAGGDPTGRAALRGIVVGDRGDVPPALDQRWRAVGIYHVLSVSGLHLAVVAGLLFALLRRLLAMSPWGGRIRPARWAAPPALVVAIAYTMVTGAQIATLRSLLVVALVLVGQLVDRPLRLVDALGVAALAILVWRPLDLYDPSFELSFTAALVLALRPPSSRGKLARGIAASAWLALATAPLTAYHFQQVQPGGILGNIALTPPVELVALPLALAGLALGLAPLIALASYLVAAVDWLAGLLAHATPVGTIAIASRPVMAALVLLAVWLSARAVRDRRDVLAWLTVCALWTLGRDPPAPGALRVTFLDVGQGDAAIVELPDGAVWLVDAGGLPNARDPSAPGRTIDRVLAAYGHTRVDLAILSHPHPDHYLGFAGMQTPIAERWSARELERPVRGARSAPEGARGSIEKPGQFASWTHPPLGARTEGEVTLEVLAPRYGDGPDAIEAADPVRTVNDNSLVVAIRYRGRAIVFAGDLEAEGEDALVGGGLGHVDVVKVPHHGSPTSSTAAFVAATHPALAVISCGRGNHFGFPAADVIARWRAAGAEVARTDEDGAVTVTIDATGGMSVSRFAGPVP